MLWSSNISLRTNRFASFINSYIVLWHHLLARLECSNFKHPFLLFFTSSFIEIDYDSASKLASLSTINRLFKIKYHTKNPQSNYWSLTYITHTYLMSVLIHCVQCVCIQSHADTVEFSQSNLATKYISN